MLLCPCPAFCTHLPITAPVILTLVCFPQPRCVLCGALLEAGITFIVTKPEALCSCEQPTAYSGKLGVTSLFIWH